MPGMMDTVLNLGLNDRVVEGLARRSRDERFAYDSYRRFIQMYGQVVFGNMGGDCATGVAFTRNPSTGTNELYGEYLVNAQGEDVVAGIRTPQHLTIAGKQASRSALPAMEEVMPEVLTELYQIRRMLEDHYRDMQDIEFTVQRGKLWMLQTRSGKRTAQAALKIAVSLVEDGLIGRDEAIRRIEPDSLDQLLHPTLDPAAKTTVLSRGLPASP